MRLSALLVFVFPFVLFSFAKYPCSFSVPLKTFLNQVTLITMVTCWETQSSATVFASQFVNRGQVVQKLSQLLRLSEVQATHRMNTLLLLSMLQTLKFLYG